jgi:CxxC motif-containing protein
MQEKTKILCITCPKGCTLEVTHDGQTIVEIKPGCKRGHEYAHRELVDPRRMVASTVKVRHGIHPLLPVYTSAPLPKGKIRELLTELRQFEISAPVTMGTVLIENVFGTGVNILASRDMPEQIPADH